MRTALSWLLKMWPCALVAVAVTGLFVVEASSQKEVLFHVLVELGFSVKEAESLAAKPCDRKRFWCNSKGLVTNLRIVGQGLSGRLSPELGRLVTLEYIGLHDNQLRGSIPSEIGQLMALEHLDLSNNRLDGRIPPELGQLSKLTQVMLGSNQLNGPIPKELGQLKALTWLILTENRLSGELPKELGQLSALLHLFVNGNQMTGEVPKELGNENSSLREIQLSNNHFCGPIPETFGEIRSLKMLSLWSNNFSGELPKSLGTLPRLVSLNLAQNQLRGSIPGELGNLTKLQYLYLDQNRLSGEIPKDLGKMSRLKRLSLGENRLSGKIPGEVAKMKRLIWVNLCQNHLTGEIPKEFGKLWRRLRWLHLDVNQLSGSIPEELGRLRNIQVLDFGHNHLQGGVTHVNWTQMRFLSTLSLGNNFLSGALPKLPVMDLKNLDLSHNRFTGSLDVLADSFCIYEGTGQLQQRALSQIHVNHNYLTGGVPECLMKLRKLKHISMNNNRLEGRIPAFETSELVVLTLHRNELSGALPSSLEKLERLAVLTLHENNLDGSLGALKLTAPCIDNNKLNFRGIGCGMLSLLKKPANFTCKTWEGPGKGTDHLTPAERLLVEQNCPELCNTCDDTYHGAASSKATFHHNRFSCELPQSMQGVNSTSIYATAVMGNMVGNGRKLNVSWISVDENFSFLYYSPKIWRMNVVVVSSILTILILVLLSWKFVSRRLRESSRNLKVVATARVAASNFALLKVTMASIFVSSPLFAVFLLGSGYYKCCPPLSQLTVANLKESPTFEKAAIAIWCFLMFLFRLVHCSMPYAVQGDVGPPLTFKGFLLQILNWSIWICIVTILSLPSILFAVSQALPANNTAGLNEQLLNNLHGAAPFLIVAIDQLLAHPFSTAYSKLSGLEADRLLMAFRLFSAWLLSVLTTIVLHENCLGGWKLFWIVCKEGSPEHESFQWRIWSEEILDPKKDMCEFSHTWWADGRCTRSIVDGLTPLLLKKLLVRTVVQPVIYLFLFYASRLDPDDMQVTLSCSSTDGRRFKGRHLRLFGGPKVTGCLVPLRQTALLTTFLETVFFWSPLVPLLSLAILSATLANHFIFDLAVRNFHVQVPSDAMNRGAFLSRSYLTLSLFLSCGFQIWHAFGTKMKGRYVLLAVILCLNGPWAAKLLPLQRAKAFFWSDLHRVEIQRAETFGSGIELQEAT